MIVQLPIPKLYTYNTSILVTALCMYDITVDGPTFRFGVVNEVKWRDTDKGVGIFLLLSL